MLVRPNGSLLVATTSEKLSSMALWPILKVISSAERTGSKHKYLVADSHAQVVFVSNEVLVSQQTSIIDLKYSFARVSKESYIIFKPNVEY